VEVEMDTPNDGHHPVLGAERRDWYRLPISIPFFVRGTESNGQEFVESTNALNVSAGGVLLATKRYMESDTDIALEAPIALAHKAHLPHIVSLLHATVLRCTPERHYFLLGLRFEKPLIAASSESEGDSSAANP
jgi:hypothetical protein